MDAENCLQEDLSVKWKPMATNVCLQHVIDVNP